MRTGVLCLALCACGSSDPELGTANWVATPGTGLPTSLFPVTYSRWSSTEVAIHTFNFDEEIHCSEIPGGDGGTLEIRISRPGVVAPGVVPIAETLDPAVPSATLKLGTRVYTSGTINVLDVDGRVRAMFDASEPASTLRGDFNGTRCD